MALERVEIAQARGPQDRRPECQVFGVEHRIVVLVPRPEALDQLGQGLDAKAAAQVVVERRDRLPEEEAIVGELRVGRDRAAPRDLQVDPAPAVGVEGRDEPPRGTDRPGPLSGVGDLHRRSTRAGCIGRSVGHHPPNGG
jgi:hypothetical protein